MDLYTKGQQIANKYLEQFNQGVIQYVSKADSTPNAPAPTFAAAVPITIKGATRGVPRKYIDGTRIVQSDLMLTASVDKFGATIPDVDGMILVNGRKHNIVAVMPVPPSGVTVVYKIIFRTA